jgi:hypothetical protein
MIGGSAHAVASAVRKLPLTSLSIAYGAAVILSSWGATPEWLSRILVLPYWAAAMGLVLLTPGGIDTWSRSPIHPWVAVLARPLASDPLIGLLRRALA